jgi:hypothetical protein
LLRSQLDVARINAWPRFDGMHRENREILRACLSGDAAELLLGDLFWWTYLTDFGQRHTRAGTAAPSPSTTREVLWEIARSFTGDSKLPVNTIDAAQLDMLLQNFNVCLSLRCRAEVIGKLGGSDDATTAPLGMVVDVLSMQTIRDFTVAQIEEDCGVFERRVSRWLSSIMSPFRLSVAARDAVLVPFCDVVAAALHAVFKILFSERATAIGAAFRERLVLLTQTWLSGWDVPLPKALSTPRASPCEVLSPRRPPQAHLGSRPPSSARQRPSSTRTNSMGTPAVSRGVTPGPPRPPPLPDRHGVAQDVATFRSSLVRMFGKSHVASRRAPPPPVDVIPTVNNETTSEERVVDELLRKFTAREPRRTFDMRSCSRAYRCTLSAPRKAAAVGLTDEFDMRRARLLCDRGGMAVARANPVVNAARAAPAMPKFNDVIAVERIEQRNVRAAAADRHAVIAAQRGEALGTVNAARDRAAAALAARVDVGATDAEIREIADALRTAHDVCRNVLIGDSAGLRAAESSQVWSDSAALAAASARLRRQHRHLRL